MILVGVCVCILDCDLPDLGMCILVREGKNVWTHVCIKVCIYLYVCVSMCVHFHA